MCPFWQKIMCSPLCPRTHLRRSPEQLQGIYCKTFLVQRNLAPTVHPANTTSSQMCQKELLIFSSLFLRMTPAVYTPHPYSAVRLKVQMWTNCRVLSWQHLREANIIFLWQLLSFRPGLFRNPRASPLLNWLAYVLLWFLTTLYTKYKKMAPVFNYPERVWTSNMIIFHNESLRCQLSSVSQIHFLDEDKQGKWVRGPQRTPQWQKNHLCRWSHQNQQSQWTL